MNTEKAEEWNLPKVQRIVEKLSYSDQSRIRDEMYSFRQYRRMLSSHKIALYNAWSQAGMYDVHKSKRNYSGNIIHDGQVFVVSCTSPAGVIQQMFMMTEWDLLIVPETDVIKSKLPGSTYSGSWNVEKLNQMNKKQNQ